MISRDELERLATGHGTPILVMDHGQLRQNYNRFRRLLPRVQVYYAVKANPDPTVARTLYEVGSGFDVASMAEFRIVNQLIRHMPAPERKAWIWDHVIYANPIKMQSALKALDRFKILVTYDNAEEIYKIERDAPHAGLVLRLAVPNTGAVCELSSKCGADAGEAVDLILEAEHRKLHVEGISFHVGSQTTNFENFVQAINLAAHVMEEARSRGCEGLNLLDIGGGFPAPYDSGVKPFDQLAPIINTELDRLFHPSVEIIAEPGRFLVATAGTAVMSIIGKAHRNGKCCYYVDDGVYHTFSGILFDHAQYRLKAFRRGKPSICTVFGPTCDALDVISMAESLPENLMIGDRLFSPNIGAYSSASSTHFNGFPPARMVHVNR